MPLAIVVLALTVLRLFIAASVPLAPDETYYWTWSRALAPGYLDHPPMVALWIAAGTAMVGKSALGVRLLGPVTACMASYLLFDAGRHLFPGTRAGHTAALLLNASLFLGVGSVIMTPDTPLLVFWTATLWAASRIATGGSGRWWLVAGLCGGLALDSKYTALLLWFGLGLWVLVVPGVRPWLRRWQPYAGTGLGFLLFLPVLIWNANHRWAGLIKQGGRVGDWRPARAAGFLAELVGGQLGLATPLVFVVCMMGLGACIRRLWRHGTRERAFAAWSLLAALSVPPVFVFLEHAIGDRVQGNWPAIIYPALSIAAAGAIINRRWMTTAVASGMFITLVVYAQVLTGFIPLPPAMNPIAQRLDGWDDLARNIAHVASTDHAAFVAVEGYALASELAWWMPGPVPVLGADERWLLTRLPHVPHDAEGGLLVRDARREQPLESSVWSRAVRIDILHRNDMPRTDVAIYRVQAAQGAVLTELPR